MNRTPTADTVRLCSKLRSRPIRSRSPWTAARGWRSARHGVVHRQPATMLDDGGVQERAVSPSSAREVPVRAAIIDGKPLFDIGRHRNSDRRPGASEESGRYTGHVVPRAARSMGVLRARRNGVLAVASRCTQHDDFVFPKEQHVPAIIAQNALPFDAARGAGPGAPSNSRLSDREPLHGDRHHHGIHAQRRRRARPGA